jgi:hypothetical protein
MSEQRSKPPVCTNTLGWLFLPAFKPLIGAPAMVALPKTLGLPGTRAVTVLTLVLITFFALTVPNVRAQENAISPPALLQWPTQAGPNANRGFPISVLRGLIERGGNEELCKILMAEADQPIPADFEWSLCPPEFQAKVTARQGTVTWAQGAKPTDCGTNCVGRPFMTQSSFLNQPNTIFAMFYGHLDFAVDVPGPFNRNVRYGYEAQFHCLMNPGAREGDFNIRLVFGQPVVREPGILEDIFDFILLPANLSRAIEAGIRNRLSTPGSQNQSGGRCTSIGAGRAADPSFDSAVFDMPPQGTRRPIVRIPLPTRFPGKRATVRFFRITRQPRCSVTLRRRTWPIQGIPERHPGLFPRHASA